MSDGLMDWSVDGNGNVRVSCGRGGAAADANVTATTAQTTEISTKEFTADADIITTCEKSRRRIAIEAKKEPGRP